jgi:hypothetical protein
MDLGIISLIVASITALGTLLATLHIKKCHAICIDSECYKGKSVPPTPTTSDV